MVIAVGFGLRALSKVLERAGDMASDPGSRLANHLAALVVLAAAGAFFIWALKMIFFDKPPTAAKPNGVPGPAPRKADIYPDKREDEASFDADAALARYMRNRPTAPETPKPGGFGRKGL
jgi:hypothetical protein